MTIQLNENMTSKNKENEGITYAQFGFQSAAKSNSHPDAVEGYLNKVYARFLEEQRLDEQGIKDRVAKLRAEVQQEKAQKQSILAEINTGKRAKDDKEKEIEAIELEKIDIKKGDNESGDTIPFVIGSFITLLLTLYLFVFYSSSGYSAFYGVKPGNLGFINPNVFSDAGSKGGGVIALIILFPVIFLGLGFLIHDSLEKNKKLAREKKPKQFWFIAILLILTFIADAFIGYKISEGVHANNFNAGLTEELWKFNMIFSDINFYLVLILGFVVYVIWGFLLNYSLSHPYLKTESEKVKLMLENLSNRIMEKRNDLSNIIAKLHKLDSDLVTLSNKVEEKEKDIIGYENGVIPVNVSELKGFIGEFMGGWQNFTFGNFSNSKATELVEIAIKNQATWLHNKIESLNTETK
ncbi:hypothetical protein [Polluticaenibacter yanchengensis]|uniref:Beta-carotene 15,15'-monooxygenase n=1 Tax=Polluticaenibacter yanchengensis TaxID=3014562 RepID=A0ABT4UG50_9BACT|nr:hypothetical protein [Chitinophagaceae bacterium LY-5]